MDAVKYNNHSASHQPAMNGDSNGASISATDDDVIIDLWNRLGSLAVEFDNYYVSIKCFQSVLKIKQSNPQTLINLSKCCAKFENDTSGFDNTNQTINYLNQFLMYFTANASVTQSDVEQVTFQLAQLYFNVGEFEKSLTTLQRIDSGDSDLRFDILYLSALSYFQVSQTPDLEECLHRCNELASSREQKLKLHILTIRHQFREKQYQQCLMSLDSARVLERFNNKLYYYLILTLINTQQMDEAYYYSNQSVRFNPSNYHLIVVNSYLLNRVDPDLSLKNLNYVVNFNESINDFLPWFLLSYNYFKLAEFKNSFNCLQICLQKSSKVSLTWLLIGHLYLNLNQLPDALSAYSQALRLQSDEFSLGSALAWDGLSCVYQRCENQVADAIDACERSLKCFNESGHPESAAQLHAQIDLYKKNPDEVDLRTPIELPDSLILSYLNLELPERIKLADKSDTPMPAMTKTEEPERSATTVASTPVPAPRREVETTPSSHQPHPQASPQQFAPFPNGGPGPSPMAAPYQFAPPPPGIVVQAGQLPQGGPQHQILRPPPPYHQQVPYPQTQGFQSTPGPQQLPQPPQGHPPRGNYPLPMGPPPPQFYSQVPNYSYWRQ
ncbi:hypothetical protein PSN45_001366 [Yamadazyma tenuis]|uniref:uncharacterized protein n=1 Tax=Candida tenuis TaxID=2315449 RepID=UPI00279B1FF1|nr:hypothetical protein PSN45_001366 [Yamadazyma tenuis]